MTSHKHSLVSIQRIACGFNAAEASDATVKPQGFVAFRALLNAANSVTSCQFTQSHSHAVTDSSRCPNQTH